MHSCVCLTACAVQPPHSADGWSLLVGLHYPLLAGPSSEQKAPKNSMNSTSTHPTPPLGSPHLIAECTVQPERVFMPLTLTPSAPLPRPLPLVARGKQVSEERSRATGDAAQHCGQAAHAQPELLLLLLRAGRLIL